MWPLLLSITLLAYCLIMMLLAAIYKHHIHLKNRLGEINQAKTPNEKQHRRAKSKERKGFNFLNISQSMKNDIQLSGIKMRPEEFVLLWIVIIFVPAALCFTISPSVVRILGLILAGTFSMPLYLKAAIGKRRGLFERQLGDALMVISNGLRAGFSFPQSLDNVTRDMPDPIGGEFRAVSRELQLGGDIETALTKVSERMASDDMKLLTTVVVIQRQVGGNLADIIDTIAKTIRDRLAMKRSVKTMTAQGRISGKIIGFLPIGLLVVISMINPTYMAPFFTTTFGHVMLAVGAIMEIIGFIVIRKIVAVKF